MEKNERNIVDWALEYSAVDHDSNELCMKIVRDFITNEKLHALLIKEKTIKNIGFNIDLLKLKYFDVKMIGAQEFDIHERYPARFTTNPIRLKVRGKQEKLRIKRSSLSLRKSNIPVLDLRYDYVSDEGLFIVIGDILVFKHPINLWENTFG